MELRREGQGRFLWEPENSCLRLLARPHYNRPALCYCASYVSSLLKIAISATIGQGNRAALPGRVGWFVECEVVPP